METKEIKELRFADDEKIAGVVAGIAEYLGVNVKMARIVYAALTVLTGFMLGVIAYVIFAFVMVMNEENNGSSAMLDTK